MENDYSVDVVFGPKIEERSKDELILLKKAHGGKFRLFQVDERPSDHAIRVNDNLLFEKPHDGGTRFCYAQVIENASEGDIRHFDETFLGDASRGRTLNAEDMQNIATIPFCKRR